MIKHQTSLGKCKGLFSLVSNFSVNCEVKICSGVLLKSHDGILRVRSKTTINRSGIVSKIVKLMQASFGMLALLYSFFDRLNFFYLSSHFSLTFNS